MSGKRLGHHVSELMVLPTRRLRREALARLPRHLQHQVRCEVERLWSRRSRKRETRS